MNNKSKQNIKNLQLKKLSSLWRGSAGDFAVNWRELLIFAAVLFTQWKWKLNLVVTLFGAGFVSLLLHMI